VAQRLIVLRRTFRRGNHLVPDNPTLRIGLISEVPSAQSPQNQDITL